MKIAIGCDHGGFALKEKLKAKAVEGRLAGGFEWIDLGCPGEDSVDYPDYGFSVAAAVAEGRADRGVVICKSGVGMSIVANKVPGVRAALCDEEETARLSRLHNDANVLSLSASRVGPEKAAAIPRTWLETPFEGGRHARRVDKITEYERKRG